MRHATCDMRHATCGMRHATCDMRHANMPTCTRVRPLHVRRRVPHAVGCVQDLDRSERRAGAILACHICDTRGTRRA
eukprot:6083660-Prymnesium_polylepis.1